jgi:kynurenine formamidase
MSEIVPLLGKNVVVYDLSQALSNSTSAYQPNGHHITYVTAEESVAMTGAAFGIGPEYWPDGQGYCMERVELSTHSGTHLDAPHHYGPVPGGGRGRTVDEIPFRWCMGDGVLLDMRHKGPGESIRQTDLEAEFKRLGHLPQPYDIPLIWTGVSALFDTPGYDRMHPGLRRDATEYLVDSGVRLIGIDAWSIDRPFDVMIAEAKAGDRRQLWESHLLGREKEFAQIEMVCGLDQLPQPTGFTVLALPVKVSGASGAWARVVAIYPGDG